VRRQPFGIGCIYPVRASSAKQYLTAEKGVPACLLLFGEGWARPPFAEGNIWSPRRNSLSGSAPTGTAMKEQCAESREGAMTNSY